VIAQRFGHRATEHIREIDDALAAVIETETERVAIERPNLGDSDHRREC